MVAVDANRGPGRRSCSPSALGLGAGGRAARAPSRFFERGTDDAAKADTGPRSRRNDAAVGRVHGAASKKGSEAGSEQRAACSLSWPLVSCRRQCRAIGCSPGVQYGGPGHMERPKE